MALALRVLNPAYVAPYRTFTGQIVLAAVVAIFVLGFGWLHRLSQLPNPGRFLDQSHGSATTATAQALS
jgi:tight adherence protein B